MDHNLEDSLVLESDIASMEFDHSGVTVHQEDITLEEDNEPGDIQMGLGHIEEQIIMDSGNEEVVVSDFINEDQFFQEYTIDNSGSSVKHGENIITQGGNIIHIQPISSVPSSTSNVITVKTAAASSPKAGFVRRTKAAPQPRQVAIAPRQVAIAPRPPHTPASVQYATAPKPVALVMNSTAKQKVPLTNFIQNKGNTVLAQIGKQLVMIPANQGQKIKVMGSEAAELAHLIPSSKGSKIVVTKLVQARGISGVQIGQATSEPSSMQIAPKLYATSSASHARYVMQQKTVPLAGKIHLSGPRAKVVLTSPVKQKVNLTTKQKQVIAISAQNTNLNQVPGLTKLQTKKVYITKNPTQNVVLKASTPKSGQQVTLTTAQRTQLHPINVPGKGIQYIKLVTNQPHIPKQLTKVKPAHVPKNFVLTDVKGNLIQMSSDRVLSTQPPPLIMTTSTQVAGTTKPTKKLVRIAPVGLKTVAKSTPPRSSQSLLAPITTSTILEPDFTEETPDVTETTVSLEEFNEMVEQSNLQNYIDDTETQEEVEEETVLPDDNIVHTRLQPVTTDGDSEEADEHQDMTVEAEEYVVEEVKPHIEDEHYTIEYEDSMQAMQADEDVSHTETVTSSSKPDDSSLIVIPQIANTQLKRFISNVTNTTVEQQSSPNLTPVTVDGEVVPYEPPYTPPPYIDHDNNMVVSSGLEVRPRKACNCTKSQCLKLYCDCFANGEFCNNCNCNNCHNNLENEELRQKAIRACLERNPNAFRPKIGKGKAIGADLTRRHNKGCNCKRSGCLKNYCECYEAKIACTSMCKCVGCRNVEATLVRRDQIRLRDKLNDSAYRPSTAGQTKQPCSFMTSEVIEAVCQCLVAAAGAGGGGGGEGEPEGGETDPVADVIEEFARCLQDVINASYQAL